MAFRAWAADENVNNAHIKRKMVVSLNIPIDQWWSEAPFARQRTSITFLPQPARDPMWIVGMAIPKRLNGEWKLRQTVPSLLQESLEEATGLGSTFSVSPTKMWNFGI